MVGAACVVTVGESAVSLASEALGVGGGVAGGYRGLNRIEVVSTERRVHSAKLCRLLVRGVDLERLAQQVRHNILVHNVSTCAALRADLRANNCAVSLVNLQIVNCRLLSSCQCCSSRDRRLRLAPTSRRLLELATLCRCCSSRRALVP